MVADDTGATQLLEQLEHFVGLWSQGGGIAKKDDFIDTLPFNVGDNCFKGDEVPVYV